jgi:hypothetical protein
MTICHFYESGALGFAALAASNWAIATFSISFTFAQ